MTSESAMLTSNIRPVTIAPSIHTADNSKLHISHIGDISTTSLSISDAYLVPQLTLNLISVGRLCDLGYGVYFSNRGCIVQEPRTGHIIGTGCRVGRLFELVSLSFPSEFGARCGLGHISFSRLHPLISSGVFGSCGHQ